MPGAKRRAPFAAAASADPHFCNTWFTRIWDVNVFYYSALNVSTPSKHAVVRVPAGCVSGLAALCGGSR